jgi:hypothetical protein
MEFYNVKNLTVPEGSTKKISHNGVQLWERNKYIYVSFGDSIAAGHSINSDWEVLYGEKSQYGVNGNTETVIVPNCYTDLIRQQIVSAYGINDTDTRSFARSGDQVQHLIDKLDHEIVKEWVRKADLVTICIGANNILTPALEVYLEKYINAGDSALVEFDATINSNLAILSAGRDGITDKYPEGSYGLLFDKLYALNKKATYILTTIYNPYKYLWIDDGTNGFFAPLLSLIPDWTITIPFTGLGINVGELIRAGLLQTPIFRKLYDRINGLGDWVDPRIEKLNVVIRNAVAEYNAYRQSQSNFKVTETKQTFDTYPDRPVSAPVHYNDLVNVEFTRGFDVSELDWGKMWEDSNALTFWSKLATKYIEFTTSAPFFAFHIDSMAEELVAEHIVPKVIVPDVDPHPEEYGHIVLKSAFNQVMQLQ